METTEEVSSDGMEKRVERRQGQRSAPFAREKPRVDWKKDLQVCGAGGESRKITQKAHAVRDQETKWGMSDLN